MATANTSRPVPPNPHWDAPTSRISDLIWDLFVFVLSKTRPGRERS